MPFSIKQTNKQTENEHGGAHRENISGKLVSTGGLGKLVCTLWPTLSTRG
jgi:hypothetical protein